MMLDPDSAHATVETSEGCIAVAAGAVDITPHGRMVPLAGLGHRREPATGVDDAVTASGLVIRDHTDRMALLVSIDALFVGPRLHTRLLDLASRRAGIASNDVLILASHTHSAPALDPTKPLLGQVDEAHLEWAISQCERMLTDLLAGPCSTLMVRAGISEWNGAVNRRRPWPLPHVVGRWELAWGEPAMAPYPRGRTDTRIGVWELSTLDGAPRAVVWTCACHPSGYPNSLRISSDFCGVVRERIWRLAGATLPILFMQGFCGDLRPHVPERKRQPAQALRTLIVGPELPIFDRQSWSMWSETLAGAVACALSDARSKPAHPVTGRIRSASINVPLRELLVGGDPPAKSVVFHRLQIGNLIDIVAVSAEPCTLLQTLIPFEGATPVGYAGDVFGYWPTERQRIAGGYEGRRFLPYFGLSGQLRPGLDDIFRAAVAGLSDLS